MQNHYFQSERQSLLLELTTWCKSVGIKDVVMLSSCNAYERWDYHQIMGPQFRYLTYKIPETDVENLKLVIRFENFISLCYV